MSCTALTDEEHAALADDRRLLRELLEAATKGIEPGYFMLTHSDKRGRGQVRKYRERVYTYELYHQLRTRWQQGCRYSLGGEPDKRGHPLFTGDALSNVNPDVIVHEPGNMCGNLCVIEVKPANARPSLLRKDITTLNELVSKARYSLGILLIYGPRSLTSLHKLGGICGRHTEVWWHPEAAQSAWRVAGAEVP